MFCAVVRSSGDDPFTTPLPDDPLTRPLPVYSQSFASRQFHSSFPFSNSFHHPYHQRRISYLAASSPTLMFLNPERFTQNQKFVHVDLLQTESFAKDPQMLKNHQRCSISELEKRAKISASYFLKEFPP
jgi:hypothetical protein